MDELDRRILAILLDDAHTPFRTIADQAGTTVGTVHNRIKKMRELGVIRRFVADVDASRMGFGICAVIELRIDGDDLVAVQRELAKDPHIVSVYDVTGDMDTVFIGKFRDTEDLDGFVKKTRQHPNVTDTRTRLVLNVVKEGVAPQVL